MLLCNQLCQQRRRVCWINLACQIVLASSGAAFYAIALDTSAAFASKDGELLPLNHQTPAESVTLVTDPKSVEAIAPRNSSTIPQEKTGQPLAVQKNDRAVDWHSFPALMGHENTASGTLEEISAFGVSPSATPLAVHPKRFVSGSAADLLIDSAENVAQTNTDSQQQQPSNSAPEVVPGGDAIDPGDPELGIIRLRPSEEPPPLTPTTPPLPPSQRPTPTAQRQPLLHLLPRVGYYFTNNVFSSDDKVSDSLILSSLTLWMAPELTRGTYLSASLDGNLVRYIRQPEYNYNLLRARVGIRQRLTPQMFGEIGWGNQQFFRAEQGDRFLRDHAIYLSLSRRDLLTRRLVLDSYYDFRVNFSEPNNRSRIANSVYLSLSYYLQKNFQIGMDYQYERFDYTRDNREDQYHRVLGRLTYGTLSDSQITLLGGMTAGNSSESFIDFNGFFFSVTYSVDLPIF